MGQFAYGADELRDAFIGLPHVLIGLPQLLIGLPLVFADCLTNFRKLVRDPIELLGNLIETAAGFRSEVSDQSFHCCVIRAKFLNYSLPGYLILGQDLGQLFQAIDSLAVRSCGHSWIVARQAGVCLRPRERLRFQYSVFWRFE